MGWLFRPSSPLLYYHQSSKSMGHYPKSTVFVRAMPHRQTSRKIVRTAHPQFSGDLKYLLYIWYILYIHIYIYIYSVHFASSLFWQAVFYLRLSRRVCCLAYCLRHQLLALSRLAVRTSSSKSYTSTFVWCCMRALWLLEVWKRPTNRLQYKP